MRAPRTPAASGRPPILREVRDVPLTDLKANPRNPRKHPEDQILRLMASLRTDGQTKPVMARRENMMLIAGHGVHQAAERLGWTTLNVVLLDVDQPTADRIMLGDNRQSDLSSDDQSRVAELLREISEQDWLATGFNADEVGKIFSSISSADLVIHEIHADDRKDTFWISVRGPLQDQAHALQRLKTLLAEMPAVEVTLGTTDDFS